MLISGTEFNDTEEIRVTRKLSELGAGGNFSAVFDNTAGKHKNDFGLNKEVLIYCGSSYPATGSLFTGILEDIEFSGKGAKDEITISGRDYTARLMDRTVEPEVYSNLPAGSIVKDIITKYTENILIGSIQDTSTTVQRMVFNHTNVYDAVKQLAEVSNSVFFIDTDKFLHFEPSLVNYSNLLLSSGNVINSKFRAQRSNIFNEVWIYGDRYYSGYKDFANVGSLTGSVWTLTYKPHNTLVEWNGNTLKGGVYEMNLIPASGLQYLISFHERQLIFVSGTSNGDNVPATGSGIVTYDRDLPIVRFKEDRVSEDAYGKRDFVLINKDIKDPNMATSLMNANLNKYKDLQNEGTITVKHILNANLGDMINVNLPYQNAVGSDFQIIETTHKFNTDNCKKEEVLTLKVE